MIFDPENDASDNRSENIEEDIEWPEDVLATYNLP